MGIGTATTIVLQCMIHTFQKWPLSRTGSLFVCVFKTKASVLCVFVSIPLCNGPIPSPMQENILDSQNIHFARNAKPAPEASKPELPAPNVALYNLRLQGARILGCKVSVWNPLLAFSIP
jgi:hypothetical protein